MGVKYTACVHSGVLDIPELCLNTVTTLCSAVPCRNVSSSPRRQHNRHVWPPCQNSARSVTTEAAPTSRDGSVSTCPTTIALHHFAWHHCWPTILLHVWERVSATAVSSNISSLVSHLSTRQCLVLSALSLNYSCYMNNKLSSLLLHIGSSALFQLGNFSIPQLNWPQ